MTQYLGISKQSGCVYQMVDMIHLVAVFNGVAVVGGSVATCRESYMVVYVLRLLKVSSFEILHHHDYRVLMLCLMMNRSLSYHFKVVSSLILLSCPSAEMRRPLTAV